MTGQGNIVALHYPASGEREEVLSSLMPSLNAEQVVPFLEDLDFLIFVINSGYDVELEDWIRIRQAACCPVWLDIHSLVLSRELGSPRTYRALEEWPEWVRGTDYVQANKKEIACMLGNPELVPRKEDLRRFASAALDLGLEAVFITLGEEGVFVVDSSGERQIAAPSGQVVMDTTGCGDVFCAATVHRLLYKKSPFEAAEYGSRLASRAASALGVEETFRLIKNTAENERE
jgi:sugar/nucleoside kinase (ribokinase family)